MSDIEDIGVSVGRIGDSYYSLTFHMRESHIAKLGKPKSILIRGQPNNGFLLAPAKNGEGVKPSLNGSVIYLKKTLADFELSRRTRRKVVVQSKFENGSIRIPMLPAAWIDVEPEFDPDNKMPAGKPTTYETATEAILPKQARDDGLTIRSEAKPNGGNGVSPLPRAGNIGENYKVPDGADIHALQAELGQKLAEARTIIQHMRDRTGLNLVLDRNLRLQVALPG